MVMKVMKRMLPMKKTVKRTKSVKSVSKSSSSSVMKVMKSETMKVMKQRRKLRKASKLRFARGALKGTPTQGTRKKPARHLSLLDKPWDSLSEEQQALVLKNIDHPSAEDYRQFHAAMGKDDVPADFLADYKSCRQKCYQRGANVGKHKTLRELAKRWLCVSRSEDGTLVKTDYKNGVFTRSGVNSTTNATKKSNVTFGWGQVIGQCGGSAKEAIMIYIYIYMNDMIVVI